MGAPGGCWHQSLLEHLDAPRLNAMETEILRLSEEEETSPYDASTVEQIYRPHALRSSLADGLAALLSRVNTAPHGSLATIVGFRAAVGSPHRLSGGLAGQHGRAAAHRHP